MADRWIQMNDFTPGLRLLEDETKSPFGSARDMLNVVLNDRKSLSRRDGSESVAEVSGVTAGVDGLFAFRKSDGSEPILVFAANGSAYYVHPTLGIACFLDSSLTAGEDCGFHQHLGMDDQQAKLYFCDRTEDVRQWDGFTATLSAALAGGETSVPINESTLETAVYEYGTASASHSATTAQVGSAKWAASQWNGFYVRITSGALTGQVRLITATTSDTITFDTLGSDPGACAFEIRLLKVPATGTLVINSTTVAYTAVPTDSSFTVASAPAAADDSPVATAPVAKPAMPRASRFASFLGRVVCGRVRSALYRNSAGTLKGDGEGSSYYASKLSDPTDFAYSASRAAGEGAFARIGFGKGEVTDVVEQEGTVYAFKRDYAETAYFTADANDLLVREPLKPGVGSVGRTLRAKDDVYFFTPAKELTSIGRVTSKDATPQTTNVGAPIKRLLDAREFDGVSGAEYQNRLMFACRRTESAANDRIVVWNASAAKNRYGQAVPSFEGEWSIGCSKLAFDGDSVWAGHPARARVTRLLVGASDVAPDGTKMPISASWKSNWFSVAPSGGFALQSCYGFAASGRIAGSAPITFRLHADFSEDPAVTVTLTPTETSFLLADSVSAFLGGDPLACAPLGSISDDGDGFRRFNFYFYFPFVLANWLSLSVESDGVDQQWEVTRMALAVKEDTAIDYTKVKA